MGDENGYPTDKLTALYERLAKGEVGAIITGYIGVAEIRSSIPLWGGA